MIIPAYKPSNASSRLAYVPPTIPYVNDSTVMINAAIGTIAALNALGKSPPETPNNTACGTKASKTISKAIMTNKMKTQIKAWRWP